VAVKTSSLVAAHSTSTLSMQSRAGASSFEVGWLKCRVGLQEKIFTKLF